MKRVLPALTVIVIFCALFSCQREANETITNRVQNDSVYLDRLVVVDPTGPDTSERDFLFYDNQKRLSRLITISNWSGSLDSTIFEFFYPGTDTLPFKMAVNEEFLSLFYSDTVFFTYSNGIVIKDSTVSWELTTGNNSGAEVTEFSLSGSTVNVLEKFYGYSAGSYVLAGTDQGSVSVVFSNGNLLSQNRVSGGAVLYDKIQASYDNKSNPISKAIKIKYPILESAFFSCIILQRNNPLQVRLEEPQYAPEEETYTYIYRSDNYPLQRTSSRGDKTLFFYKSL